MGLFDKVFASKAKPFQGIPGPTPHLPLGSGTQFIRSALGGKPSWLVSEELALKYGGLTLIWIGSSPSLVVNDPELISDVFVRRMGDFYKKSPTDALIPLTTDQSPFVLNGSPWQKAREVNPFTQKWFDLWLDQRLVALSAFLIPRIEALGKGQKVDLQPTIQRLTFDAFSISMMGQLLDDQAYQDFLYLTKVGSFRINTGMSLLPPGFAKVNNRWSKTFATVTEKIAAKPDPEATDLVNTMLRYQPGISQAAIAVILSNVYFGGCISVASGVATNLYLVGTHPEAALPVHAQLRNRGSQLDTMALAQANELEYALMESLRLLGPVPIFTRNTHPERTVPFGGHQIPPDTTLIMSNWHIQRNNAYWGDGSVYRPARWAKGGLERDPLGSGHFFPFGMGPRTCMGKPFALWNLRIFTALFHEKLNLTAYDPFKQCNYFGGMNAEKLMVSFKKP